MAIDRSSQNLSWWYTKPIDGYALLSTVQSAVASIEAEAAVEHAGKIICDVLRENFSQQDVIIYNIQIRNGFLFWFDTHPHHDNSTPHGSP